MKKIAAICLLLIAFYSMLSFVVFKMQQFAIYREVKNLVKTNVDDCKLVHFQLLEQDYKRLDWEKPDKEFKLNNKMYDVIKFEKVNDTIYLSCINDVQEENLIENYLSQNNHHLNPNKSKSKNIKTITSKISYFISNESRIKKLFVDRNNILFTSTENQLVTGFISIQTPPPRIFS